MARKLDHVMSNEIWMEKFGQIAVEFLECGMSDHSPAHISVGKVQQTFLSFLIFGLNMNESFLSWVDKGWKIRVQGVPLFILYAKLKSVRRVLKGINAEVIGGINQKVIQAKARLDQVQKEYINSHGSPDWLQKEKECIHESISISKAEENFLKQKSRNQWLNFVDRYNAFFHRIVKVRNSKNLIKHLWGMRKEEK